MDTLCIPVQREDYSLRLVQIDMMASIYKGATSCLVLDAELMDTRLILNVDERTGNNTIVPNNLARARLLMSAWMFRSWTLQEGSLSPAIAVQFKDSVVGLGRISEIDGHYAEWGGTEERLVHGSAVGPQHCRCIDIALERHFFSTFFQESQDFASVWNELSGRSTTLPDDIPLVVSNLLDLDNRQLLKSHNSSEMLQEIIWSLDQLPLSLFFNTDARDVQYRNHYNRWIPTRIGAWKLASQPLLTVCSNYLLYEHQVPDTEDQVDVYIVDEVLRMDERSYIYLEEVDACYVIEPTISDADQFDRVRYDSTCIVVDKETLNAQSNDKRAAVFYTCDINNHQAREDQVGENDIWWRRVLRRPSSASAPEPVPGMDMTFYCSVRLRLVAASECMNRNPENTCRLLPVRNTCNFRIRYSTFPPPRS